MEKFIKALLLTENYWFVIAYLLMYIVFPFLNVAIHGMNKKQHLMCCVTLLFVFSFIHNLIYFKDYGNVKGGYSFLWFCILYIIAAYFRLYIPERSKYQKWMIPTYIICCLGVYAERFLAYIITPHIFGKVQLTSLFYSYNSILIVPASLCLFQFFRGISVSNKRISSVIRFIAPLTFAVYLIHEHVEFRIFLWKWIDMEQYADSAFLILIVLGISLSIFIVCCAIEYMRRWIFCKIKITNTINIICDCVQMNIMKCFNSKI